MSWFRPSTPQDKARTAAEYAAVFTFSGLLAAVIEWFPMFRDPDSFYHLKMALLMSERGVIREFPWLPFTTLAEHYADHHLLYHVLLIPFIRAFGPFHGMLLATAVFAATALTLFHALLRSYEVRWAPAFTFILATASAFIFRLDLAKAGAISLSLVFLALLAIRYRQPAAMFVVAWVYVLAYGGWPLVLVIAGTALASRIVSDRLLDVHPWHSWISRVFRSRALRDGTGAWRESARSAEVQLFLAALLGMACGLVINPYFPDNLLFYWEQIVQIAVIGQRDVIGVGSEWYPYTLDRLIGESGAAPLALMCALALFALMTFWPETVRADKVRIGRDESVSRIMMSFLTAVFFLMALRSKRHIEYLVPFLALLSALLFQSLLGRLDPTAAKAKLAELFPRAARHLLILASAGSALLLFIGIRDVALARRLYSEGIPWSRYERATAWIAAHAPQGEVVVHSDWDDFPILFFRDDGRRYVSGLDPTFLHRRDPELRRRWVDLTAGRDPHPAETMREAFGSHYALIEKDYQEMIVTFSADPAMTRAYEDDEAVIFMLP